MIIAEVNDRLRKEVIAKDQYQCQLCRLKYPETYPFEIAFVSSTKQVYSVEYLATICLTCKGRVLEPN